MKNLTIILALMISSFIGNAQDFIDTTKVWTVSERIHNGSEFVTPTTLCFKFAGDSVIGDLRYMKMLVNSNNSLWAFHSLWRDDQQGKIYCKRGHSTESLIYNFSLNKGDTLFFDSNEAIVDSTAMKLFGGATKKHIYAHYTNVPDHLITWVKGVGSLYGPDISDHFFLVGGKYTLICFEENNEHVYLNPMYTACNAQSGTRVIEFGGLSDFVINPIGSGVLQFINPAGSYGVISFVSVDGRTVKKHSIASSEGIIPIPYKGILMYRFFNNNNQVQTGKVLVR